MTDNSLLHLNTMVTGPIILIEDDPDDKELIETALKELDIPNKTVWFSNSIDAFEFLKNKDDQPFIIFSDINLPRMTGIEFKKKIDNDPELRRKSIPFVFFSTSADKRAIDEAYTKLTVQGY